MAPFAQAPNLRHLRMVQVTGRVGRVSEAARILCTSQPAVTQALIKFEHDIGVPIFERAATGTYPTEAGRQYLLRLDRFFEILDAALAHLLGAQGEAPRADRLITGAQLRSVIAIGEQERVAGIAAELGISRSALFRSARELERAVGMPLFDRTAQGPVPTRSGEILAREFRCAARELELGRGELLLSREAGDLELVVGALPMAGSPELSDATQRFKALHPQVKVRLVVGEYRALLTDLHDSRIDLMFGLLRAPPGKQEVREEVLFHDSYCVVARPGHPLSALADVSAADLAPYPWVVPSAGTPRRTRIEAIFGSRQPRPRFEVETSSLGMSRALLLRSDMVTLMTRSEVQYDVDLGVLACLRCAWLDDELPKGVTTRADWLPTRAHQAFMESLRSITRRLPRHAAGTP